VMARSSADQGIAAIPENILKSAGLGGSAGSSDIWHGGYHDILNNIFVSVPITQATMQFSAGDNVHYFLTSINPLPSVLTDFAEIDYLLNTFTPVNALGDLIRSGKLLSSAYFFCAGFYIASLEANLRSVRGSSLIRLAQVGLVLMFALATLQYPLRTGTRLLYYAIFIDVGLVTYEFLKLKRRIPTASGQDSVTG
jgi:hypothetical protein